MAEKFEADVAIIGGGPAGLSAALVLGRARKRVVVIDEGRPRNRVTKETHGFLTRDGVSPGEFRRIAREQLQAYPSVAFLEDAAVSAAGVDGDFRVATRGGAAVRAKKLLFAVGMRDLPVGIAGLDEVYGRSAFVCPYCDGWELRDRWLALIAAGPRALHMAKMLAGWTNHYAILTNGPHEMTEEQLQELERHGVPVFDAPIRRIVSGEGMVEAILLEDGRTVACEGIFFAPRLAAGSELPRALGCRVTDGGTVVVDAFGKSSVPGVYAAGDAASELYQAISAAALGSLTAAGINNELLHEKWEAAN
ncbi:NAD(P)/FAD-dependent oxidoreductase [Paenibacillus sp. GCM10023250]|uniref:NAD(P)/FAD-dependent oxidoreductase n=1 Tax=Paenibacillus sp. GCM10023250 TaxID=3252648 RepID=UPI003617A509